MPRWTEDDLKEYERKQRAEANRAAGRVLPGAEPERPVRHALHPEVSGEKKDTPRFRVRITSFRKRLLDPDNLAGGCKYFIDCCRYCGLIPNDRPEDIIFESRQEKVASSVQEYTEVIIEEIV